MFVNASPWEDRRDTRPNSPPKTAAMRRSAASAKSALALSMLWPRVADALSARSSPTAMGESTETAQFRRLQATETCGFYDRRRPVFPLVYASANCASEGREGLIIATNDVTF
jgi:hypothetical protein